MNKPLYIDIVIKVQGFGVSCFEQITTSILEEEMRHSYLDYAMSIITRGEPFSTSKEPPRIQPFPEKKHFKKINTAPAQKNRYVNFLCIKENILLFLISRFNTSAYNDERLAIHG